eukprot:c44894_g1_i1 orf=3-158(-)
MLSWESFIRSVRIHVLAHTRCTEIMHTGASRHVLLLPTQISWALHLLLAQTS